MMDHAQAAEVIFRFARCEYCGHIYECTGISDDLQKWVLSDVNDGSSLFVTTNDLMYGDYDYYEEG